MSEPVIVPKTGIMNRVARGLRTIAGIVLLCLLASTVTAGAVDPAPTPHASHRADEADLPPIASSTRRATSDDVAGGDRRAIEDQPSFGKKQPSSEKERPSAKEQQSSDKPSSTPAKGPNTEKQNDEAGGSQSLTQKQQPLATPAKRRADNATWGAFDETLRGRLAGSNLAVSAAVSVGGEVVHTVTFGERVAGRPTQASDRFRIASISKVFAATAALRLVDRGELALDEPVTGKVAEALGVVPADPRAATITLRQLLGHTSGFGDHDGEFFGGGADSCSAAATIAFSRTLSGQPGASSNYSNMNFCLVGLVLEHATGKPYAHVVNEQVLKPLGIDAMRTGGTFDIGLRDVRHPASAGRNYMETLGAAGAWLATPSDVVALMNALNPASPGKHPVSNELLGQMKAPVSATGPGPPGQQWYGLGLMVFDDGSYGHTGTLEGAHAMTVARPDGVTWAVTVSGETPSTTADLRGMVDTALGAAGLA